jgi:DNA-binding MarR family transcriptional regulator/predicted GNAT family N-acyltransferase
MDVDAVAQVRRFNRTVTQRVGALDDTFLSRSRPLGHSRVLWEIGADGADIRALRSRLDLDSGYLSRILRTLESEELITVVASPADGRVRVARLTEAGVRERTELDARSDEAAASVLAELGASQQRRLVSAMATVERLLLVPPVGLLLVARLHAAPVGCAAIKLHGPAPAEVKRMWVAESVRGLGLGRRLLTQIEEYALTREVRTLRLETNRTLTEAIALYRSAGYREVAPFNDEPFADHWFEKQIRREPVDAGEPAGVTPPRLHR